MRIYIKKRKWWEFWKHDEAKLIIDYGDRATIDKLFVGEGCEMECRKDSLVTMRRGLEKGGMNIWKKIQ